MYKSYDWIHSSVYKWTHNIIFFQKVIQTKPWLFVVLLIRTATVYHRDNCVIYCKKISGIEMNHDQTKTILQG